MVNGNSDSDQNMCSDQSLMKKVGVLKIYGYESFCPSPHCSEFMSSEKLKIILILEAETSNLSNIFIQFT